MTMPNNLLELLQSESFNLDHMIICEMIVREYSSDNAKVMKVCFEVIDKFYSHYVHSLGKYNLLLLVKALSYAAYKHAGQTRKDVAKTPYIIHPQIVARTLWEEGKVRSVNTLAAAFLHDILEDIDNPVTSAKEIKTYFGQRILQIVQELTDDQELKSDDKKQRQVEHAPYMSLDAQLIKLTDRLCNIRDVRLSPPPAWS